MIDGLDHVIVGVRDLGAARDAYGRLGFTLTPRGSHIGWGTGNYCIMFPDDYVELLGIIDATKFCNNLDTFLETSEGLLGIAFGTGDAEAAAAEFAARDIAVDGPKDLARNLELPDGTVRPSFKLVFPAADAMPGLAAPAPAFVCQHLTPELIRRPEWLAHANGARAIAAITVAAADPASLAPSYEALFGAAAVSLTDGVLTVRAGATRLQFAAPAGLARLHPAMADSGALPEVPSLAAMAVAVDDPAIAAGLLAAAGIATGSGAGGAISVEPADAGGVWLEFTPPDA